MWEEDHNVHLVARSEGENQYTSPLATGGKPIDCAAPFKPHKKAAIAVMEKGKMCCSWGKNANKILIIAEENNPVAMMELILTELSESTFDTSRSRPCLSFAYIRISAL